MLCSPFAARRCSGCRPQLVLNSIYLTTVGFENADPVAIFAFTMSMLSLVLNCMIFWDEVKPQSNSADTHGRPIQRNRRFSVMNK